VVFEGADAMSISRKAREAKRARALAPHRGRKAGVKLGATPLRKSEMGREVAVFGMLVRTRLRGSPIHAAEFAASVFNKSVVVTRIEGGLCFNYTGGRGEIIHRIKTTAGGVVITKHEHDPELRDDARKHRRDKILREAPKLIAGATGADRVWLEVSMQALDGAFNAIALGDDTALNYSLMILEGIGWSGSSTNSFLK
jgi:hypothetical protein